LGGDYVKGIAGFAQEALALGGGAAEDETREGHPETGDIITGFMLGVRVLC
jgi:hypothetical protein